MREVEHLRARLARAEAELQQQRTHIGDLPPAIVAKLADLLNMHGRERMVHDLRAVHALAIRLGGYEGLDADECGSLYWCSELATVLAMVPTVELHMQN